MDRTAPLRLIVPLDGSAAAERALPEALALAGADDRIVLVSVVPPPNALYDDVLRRYLPVTDQDHERREDEAHRALVEVATRYQDPRIELCVRTGEPVEEVLTVAGEKNAAMIVVASHGHGALDRWRLGSISDQIARTASIPVMLIRSGDEVAAVEPIKPRRILLMHDGSELASRAIPTAARLAKRLAVPVNVIHAIDIARVTARVTYDAPIPENVVQEIETDICARADESVRQVVETLEAEGAKAESELLFGSVGPTLLDAVQPDDVVVLSSHGRGGVRRWLLGSIAERLVRYAPAPVVLVPSERE
ncbi:MAG: universal stress protein [Thermomicrobiales bacterium]|nr:universal stress protein [Thermomicrobiales bacterium]